MIWIKVLRPALGQNDKQFDQTTKTMPNDLIAESQHLNLNAAALSRDVDALFSWAMRGLQDVQKIEDELAAMTAPKPHRPTTDR